jgi:uncharacterized repeat protein (TIGR01451 family)
VRKLFLIVLFPIFLAPVPVSAGTYVLPASQDAWVDLGNPLNNFGSDNELRNRNVPAEEDRALFQFDTSGIPAGETVVMAFLQIYVTDIDESGLPIEIYRVTDTWDEGTVTWNNTGNDFDPSTVYGSFTTPGPVQLVVDVTTLAQGWVSGALDNNGMILTATSDDVESKIASKEWPVIGYRPQLWVVTGGSPMAMNTGSYTGDGLPDRTVTGVGFRPDVVIIKGDIDEATVVKTSSMFGGTSKQLGTSAPSILNGILTLDADGFTLDSGDQVNGLDAEYYWVAFRSAPGMLAVGSYVGDGAPDRDITGLGFQPGYTIVMSEAAEQAVQRFPDQVGDASRTFDNSNETTNLIKAVLPDGFRVGNEVGVNQNLTIIHYVAWKAQPGIIAGGSYTGDEEDSRAITGAGFQPEFLILSHKWDSYETVERFAPNTGDESFRVGMGAAESDHIQNFLADGFEVGKHIGVNEDAMPFYYVAFRSPSGGADLTLKMAVDDTVKNEADTVTVAMSLSNLGPEDATGIEVTDLLPTGMTHVAHVATQGTYDFISGVWDVGAIANANSAGLSITATIDPGTAGSTLSNIGSITAADQTDPDPSTNADSAAVYVSGVDIVVFKTVDNTNPNEGETITYTVRTTNDGPDDATGLQVIDLLSDSLKHLSNTPTHGNYAPGNGQWAIGALAAGDTATLSINASVELGTAGSVVKNTAVMVAVDQMDGDAANDTASVDIVVQSVDLAISKTVDDPTPVETDLITFTVKLSNAGPNDATGVEVSDFVPAGLTYSGYTASQGSYDDASGIWDVGTLALADSVTLTIDATVDPGTSGWTISNLAVVTAIDQTDPDVVNNSASAKVTVQSSEFRVSTGMYTGDGALTRSIAGVGFRPDVVILQGDDGVPATVKSTSMPGSASKELAWDNPMYTNTLTSLDADGFTVSPDGWLNLPGNNYYWVAFKTAPGNLVVGSYDGDGSDNRAITGLGFEPRYTMILPESYNQASQRFPLQIGDASIAFGYTGENPDWIQAYLPDGFEAGADSLVNAPGLTYHYVAWNEIAGITAGGLYVGNGLDDRDVTGVGMQPEYVLVKKRDAGNGAIQRPVSLAGDIALSVRNGFTVADAVQAFLPDGFQVGTETSVNETAYVYDWFAFRNPSATAADLELAMAVNDTVPIESDTLTYTVTLRNNGPDGASGVQVIDLLPAGLTYISDVSSQGTYTDVTGLWDVGVVTSGDSATLDLLAAVDLGTVDMTIDNAAFVSAAQQADPDTTNNAANAIITVGPTELRVVSGSYTGDGVAGRAITGLGFQPDVVIVKGDTTESAILKSSSMPGDASKTIGSKSAISPNMIQTLDPDGFTVGASGRVNAPGVTYYWTAFRAARPEMIVGSYTGDDADDRSIGGVGFEPVYVIVMNEANEDAMQRFAAQFGDASLPFAADDPKSDRIQAFEPDGFQVGKHNTTNRAGDVYHYIAWNNVPGRVETDMYLGDEVDDRNVSATTFTPNFLLIQRSKNGSAGLIRNAAVSGDLALPVDGTAGVDDRIQAILPNGFQIGADDDVNKNGDTYYWTAFKDSRTLDVAVSKGVDNPSPNEGDVVEFTITVSNNGPIEATGVQVRDILPAGLTYDSATPLMGTYDDVAGVWDIGTLANGVGTALALRARVGAGTAGTSIVNTASLWVIDQIDVASGNDNDDAVITVNSADLAVAVSVDEPFPAEGDTVTYFIRLANTGPDGAAGVTVTDTLPAGVTYLADSTSQGVYDTTTGYWNLGAVAEGEADTLWINAKIDAGTMGSYLTNVVYAADSLVADPDSANNVDSVTVLVPTSVTLDDAAGSLFPASAFVGDPELALRIGVDNAWAVGVMLDTLSTISFSDGVRIYMAELANATYVPPGASDFILSFDQKAVPLTFAADSAYALTLSLTGTTDESQPYDETISTVGTNSIFIDQPKMSVDAHLIGDLTANPGQADVPLFVLRFDNHYSSDRTLDSLTVDNAAFGAGTPSQLDALTGSVTVYDDVDGSSTLSIQDTLLTTSSFSGGRAAFSFTPGWTVPALGARSLVLAAAVDSTAARDGDALNARVTSDADIVFAEATVFDGEISPLYPLDSYGVATIDGMVAHQVSLVTAPLDTLFSGAADALLLGVVIPQNGYEPDTLVSLNVMDFSGGSDPADFDRVNLYRDDGNGLFDPASDTPMGEMVYSGDRYEISGLAMPTGPGETYFVAVDVAVAPTHGNTFRPGVPKHGITVASGNDGPLDAAVISDTTYTVVKVEKIDVAALPLSPLEPQPGETGVPLLRLQVTNNTLSTVILDSLTVTNATIGPGAQADLDGEMSAVNVFVDDGNGVVDAWDTAIASGLSFGAGALTAGSLGRSLDPAETAQLLIACDVNSTCVRDSDDLRVRIASVGDLRFDSAVLVAGAFPLETGAARTINGMTSFQIGLYPNADSTVIDSTTHILVLDVEIPANGYEADTLTSLLVKNLGTADDEHIHEMDLWADGGDGTFNKGAGDDVWINSLVSVGGRQYQRSGLAWPLTQACAGGTRLFVSCDLTPDYTTGASIQFSLPGGPLASLGVGVASGNDGPIDAPITDPTSRLIPSPDELTIWGYAVGDKRVYPGSENVLNFGVGLYNGFSSSITLDEIILTRGASADHSDVERVMAFADTDGNDLFDPLIDKQIAETTAKGLDYPLSDLALELMPDKVTYLFVAYDLNIGAEDSVLVNLLLWDAENLTIPEIPKGADDRDSKITGEFPVDSPGEDITDGMIAEQITLDPAFADRAAPGDSRVLAMGLTIPANGASADQLEYVTIVNIGTAVAGQDIDRLDLWTEAGGDPDHFDPGSDNLVTALAWSGSGWQNLSALSETIPAEGLKCYVTFAAAATAVDDRTFQAVLPVGGVKVLSGNDGPLNAEITNPGVQTISTDPLITTMSTDRSSYSTGQEIVLSMRVRNEDTDSLLAVTADAPSISRPGAATYVSGPVPSSIDLAPGADTALVWRYTAATAGDLEFCGFAYDGDSTEVSLLTCTQTLEIQDKPTDIDATLADVAPIAVNRGQNNVEAIALDLAYTNFGALSAPVEFGGVVIAVEDGGGSPVAPNSVLGEITIVSSTGSNQPFVLADSAANPLHLYITDPIAIEPGDSITLDVNMDIAPGAALAPFRLSIQAATDIGVDDANDGAPVPLATGASFPWATSVIDVELPADSVLVSSSAAGSFYANNGQDQVEIFRFTLLNNGPAQTATEILRGVTLTFADDGGAPIAPNDVIRSLSLSSSGSGLFFTDVVPSSGDELTCDLASELLLPSQAAQEITVTVDMRAFPAHGGFSVSLAAPSSVVARDQNDGGFVAVVPAPPAVFPIPSATVLFQQPASGLATSHTSMVPQDILPSTFSVPLLDLSYSHTDTAASSIIVDSLAMAFIDKSGNPVFPGNYFSELCVIHAGDTLSVLTSLSSVSHVVETRLSPPVTLAPQSFESFRMYLSSKGIYTPVEFQVRIDREHVVAWDANTGERIVSISGNFPYFSDLARMQLAGDAVSCGLVSLVPANVTGRETGLPAFDFVVRNDNPPGYTPSQLRGLTVAVQNWRGATLDPSAIVSRAALTFGDSVYSATAIGASGIVFAIPDGDVVTDPGSADTLTFAVDLSTAGDQTFRFVVSDTADVDIRDAVTGDVLSARTIGDSGYPLTTGLTHTLCTADETAFTNYPNPFAAGRQNTRITFYLDDASRVTLKLYTLWGAPVKTLIDGEILQPGLHQDAVWSGKTGDGDVVNNGVYYLVLDVEPAGGGSPKSFKRKVGVVR